MIPVIRDISPQLRIREQFAAGKASGEMLLDSVSNEPDTVRGLERRVALLYKEASDDNMSYLQGMWHAVGSVPLCFYTYYSDTEQGNE